MIIYNVKVFHAEKTDGRGGCFRDGCIVLSGEQISGVYEADELSRLMSAPDETIWDGKGAYAIPGLIDLHFHGCMGDDFCDSDRDALARMAAYEASVGVTAIAPATMTLPMEKLEQVLRVAAQYHSEPTACDRADLVGINMEGPFISRAKKGAQDERYLLPCDVSLCRRFLEWSDGLIKFIGIAPEEHAHALDFIKAVAGSVHVALAHTNADYETAMAAFEAGADHVVHLYNAMPEFLHRAPGVVGAVYDSPHVMAELICDGIHVHPSAVRAAFAMMGADRIILISDSMRATGMPDGTYTLGGLDVNVRGKHAALVSNGTIAGSVTNLMDCMRTAVRDMGIPLETAAACASVNPAKCLGIYDRYGSIEAGKQADIVLLDRKLELQTVFKDGVPIGFFPKV